MTATSSPWCTPFIPVAKGSAKPGLSLSEVALFGILGGMTFAAKVAMAGLANIEPVSLMVMLFAVTFGRKAAYPIYVYVLLEFVLYGLGPWSVNYLYIWAVLALAAWLCREVTNPLGWAILSGLFGLLFGTLCAPVYFITGGWAYGLTWWANCIPFDIAHCIGNFVIALVLFVPLRYVLERLYRGLPKGGRRSGQPPSDQNKSLKNPL